MLGYPGRVRVCCFCKRQREERKKVRGWGLGLRCVSDWKREARNAMKRQESGRTQRIASRSFVKASGPRLRRAPTGGRAQRAPGGCVVGQRPVDAALARGRWGRRPGKRRGLSHGTRRSRRPAVAWSKFAVRRSGRRRVLLRLRLLLRVGPLGCVALRLVSLFSFRFISDAMRLMRCGDMHAYIHGTVTCTHACMLGVAWEGSCLLTFLSVRPSPQSVSPNVLERWGPVGPLPVPSRPVPSRPDDGDGDGDARRPMCALGLLPRLSLPAFVMSSESACTRLRG